MSNLETIASAVSAGATCVALVFAGLELRRSRAQDLRKRRVEIEGVAVSWIPTKVPHWHYQHITRDIVPQLRQLGVTDDQVTAMLVTNPRRYFTVTP